MQRNIQYGQYGQYGQNGQNKTVLFASTNKGKIKELSLMLSAYGIEVRGLDLFPNFIPAEETGATFEENALLKARKAALETGLYTITDDSGLCVPALGGAPGIFSARYSEEVKNGIFIEASDESNIAKLLQELKNFSLDSFDNFDNFDNRAAYFYCAIAAVSPNGRELVVNGKWHGHIAKEKKGEHGFGYDPIFICNETGKHAAEMTREEKAIYSHRSNALKNLVSAWQDFWK